MKKINLDQGFETFDGNVINDMGTDGKPKPAILKSVILNNIGSARSAKGEDAIKNIELGIRINDMDGIAELEDSEVEIIKKAVEQNTANYNDMVRGQALKMMEEK